jgi:hypothetical protein
MKELTFNKDVIIAKLKKNLGLHDKILSEVRKAYIEEAKTLLAERLNDLRTNKITGLHFNLSLPRDHSASFKRIIQMLEDCIEETVVLDEYEYRQFVLNEWDWKGGFIDVANAYVTGSSGPTGSTGRNAVLTAAIKDFDK